jgi:hypothetical protein
MSLRLDMTALHRCCYQGVSTAPTHIHMLQCAENNCCTVSHCGCVSCSRGTPGHGARGPSVALVAAQLLRLLLLLLLLAAAVVAGATSRGGHRRSMTSWLR